MTTRPASTLLLWLVAVFAPASAWLFADEARDQFTVAAGHYKSGRWELAAEEFQTFLAAHADDPQAPAARFYRAEALLQSGEHAAAQAQYGEYLTAQPDGPFAARARFRQGEASFLAGDRQAAGSELKAFVERHPSDPQAAIALDHLAEMAIQESRWQDAVGFCEQGLARFGAAAQADGYRFTLARALEGDGKYDEAIRAFGELAGKRASKFAARAQFHRASCQYTTERYAEAVATLTAFDRDFASSGLVPRAKLVRAWSLYQLKKYEQACELLKSIASDAQVGVDARYWLALCYERQGKPNEAADVLVKLVGEQGEHANIDEFRLRAGQALLAAKQLDEAEQQFQAILARDAMSNTAEDALLGRARVAYERKDYDAAKTLHAEHRARFAGSDRRRASFDRLAARVLVASGEAEAAVEILEDLVKSTGATPQGAHDRLLLADALQRAGDSAGALTTLGNFAGFDRVVIAQAALTRGLALAALERHEEAARAFEECLQADPEASVAALALAELAACRVRLDQPTEAKACLAQLESEHADQPVYVPACRQLAALAQTAGRLELADEAYRLLAASADESIATEGMLGAARIAYQQRDWGQCDARAEALAKRFPKSEAASEAMLLAGIGLEKSGERQRALARYQAAYDNPSEGALADKAMLAAARLLKQDKRNDEAIELYERLRTSDSDVEQIDSALYELAWLKNELADGDAAQALFQRLHDEFRESLFWSDATYRLAERASQLGDKPAATKLLDELIAARRDDRIAAFALYLRGQIAVAALDWPIAESSMQELVDRFAKCELEPEAQFWLAEAKQRQNQYEAAQALFDRLAARPDCTAQSWQAIVALRRAQLRLEKKDYAAAKEIAAGIAERYPDFKQQYEVDYALGRCLASEALFEEAREAYRRVIRSATGGKTETAAIAQWMIGESYFHQKSYRAAIKEYLRVEILYPYPNWQAAALLQAAKCHELVDERPAAVELYTRIVRQYPDSQFAAEAARRLSVAERGTTNTTEKRS